MNAFEKGYQAWKASKATLAVPTIKNNFELSDFDKNYLQWQYSTGRITEEQALAQLNKPYTDFITQVNNVLAGYDQFANNYTARFGNRKNDLTDAWVGDSKQYLNDAQTYQANMISQTDAILKTLEANPDAFDKKTVDEIKNAIATIRTNVGSIATVAEQDDAYWSSWGTDDESKVDKIMGALKSGYDFMPGNRNQDRYLTGEAAYARAQQDQTFANKYNGISGVKLMDVLNSLDGAEKEWVTGQVLRTVDYDEAQAAVDTMEQEFRELSQTGTLRNAYATGMALNTEEEAAAKAAIAQYEAVMKKYGIDTKSEDAEPMEALSDQIQQRKTLIAESQRVQEHIKLSNVRENKDFEAYAKKGEAEAMDYAEKNKKTAHMTNKEIDVLAYYIAKDKENGTNLAEQYKESLKFYLKHRRAEEIADWVNDLPGIVKALTLPRLTYAATAKTMNWGQDVLQNFSKRKLNQTVFQMADDYIGQDLTGASRIAHQAAGVVGYMAPSILASKFIGGATGAGSLGRAAGSTLMFLGSSGQAYGHAIEKGYDRPKARAYATLVGLSEVALQRVLGGISEFGGLPAMLEGKIAGIKNVLLKTAAKFGVSIIGETIEEELQNFLEPAFRSIIFGEKYDAPTAQELIDTAIVTALSTGGMEGPGIVKESVKDARVNKLLGDNISEHSFLTSRERVVVNTITDKLVAEAEQGGKKLSADEKQKIYDQVVDDMDTGRIDIQQIEEAIGKGDQYKQLVSEFEEFKELNKLEPTEMTGEQRARLAELEAKNQENNYEKAIKSYDKAFSQAVESLVKSDRLAESYRERDRRSEAYKVEDLNKYSDAQQQTIRAAMDSGILNNTRRTHEFVDFIAKVSDKLGVKFNFTDNKRLRESGFAMKDAIVNGFVNKDGITVNVNSAKALNRVVGHEVTHVLKGTKLFDKLQKVLFNYAKTKGEYDSRLQQITDLYKDKKGYTDNPAKIKEELMADLVGDYLFTDKQFVEKLFTEERGLFNWIRKHVNYLHSLATAGSKEARQLERAKKVFDDVFQNKTQENEYTADNAVQENAKTETDYSLSNAKQKEPANGWNVRGRDATYIDAVNRGDKQTAKEMVDEYAIEQGFDVDEDGEPDLLFHGTDSFGFTTIDTSMSDDNTTFWATPNMGVAGSYYEGSNYRMREIGSEKVAPKGIKLSTNASMEKALDAYQKLDPNNPYKNLKYVSESKLLKQAKKPISKAVSAAETVLNGNHSEDVKKIAQSIVDAAQNGSYDALVKAINQEKWKQYSKTTGVDLLGMDLSDNFNPEKADISQVTDVDPDVFKMMWHIGDALDALNADDFATLNGETVSKQDIILAYNEAVAEKGIYGFYHKQSNPFIYDCEGAKWNQISVPNEAKNDFGTDVINTRQLAAWAFKNGYDAIKLDNVIDVGGYALKEARNPATVWAFKNPQSQIKSADPVTYDDSGNVIPLSERFNAENKDVRYSISAPGQTKTTGGGWNVRGRDVSLPMPEGYQESPVAGTKTNQAKPVNLPGLEKNQPQSQGKAQKVNLPMPKQTPKDQQTAAREALNEALFGKQKKAATQSAQQEVEYLDAEYRRQMGDDSSYYDPAEGEEIETARERLEVQRSNLQIELRENQRLRQEVIEEFDRKIEAKQARYDAKQHKESKASQALLRSIERDKRLKADRLAEFDRAIARNESRIGILDEKLATNKPEKQDRLEKAYERIDKDRDAAELELIQKYNEQKAEVGKGLDNKEQWIKNKAFDVLWEMGEWVKGDKPSDTLGRIWDIRVDGQRIEWNDIKHALADIKDGTRVQKSHAEDAIMEVLERTYQDRVSELAALEKSFNRDVEKLNKDAEKAKEEARKSESNLLRSELHEQLVGTVRKAFTDNKLDLDIVLDDAKDLATIRTVDNTPQRVLEKALGRKAGQVLSDMTFNKVAKNETDGIRWLNSYTNRKDGALKQLSEKYNIKPGSKESAAAQMYAEGFYVNEANEIVEYGDRELAADFPDVKTQANIKGLAKNPEIRRIYDETLDLINASRVRNGYPAIQKLDNYYLHFRAMGDTFSQLGLPFNPNDIRAKDLPTDLNGVTADLKPGQPYFASAQHREGKRTSFDLLGGLEMYLTSAKNQIFHIDDIQMLRALRNYVANVYGRANGLNNLDELTDEEQEAKIKEVYNSHLSTFAKFLNESANVLAGKTSLIDRGLEGIIGRRAMTTLNDVKKQVGANMVGYNIGSPLTNFLAVMEALAKTEGFKRDFLKAAGQMVTNIFRRQSDGFTEKSSVVVRRKGAEQFSRTLWQKLGDPGYWLMSKTDEISTELIARTKYNELIRKGMDEKTAHYETDKWVSRLMGDRSLGQMPLIFNSKTLGMLTQFQLEVRNKLDSAFYDTIQEAKEIPQDVKNRNAKVAAKITSKMAQSAILDHVFGMAFKKIAGYNPAFDIISIIATAFGWNDDEDDDDTFLDNLEQAFFELLEDLPYTSTLTGGRIAIGNALPIKQLITGKDQYGNEKERWKTLLGALPYYMLPGGYGQAKKTVQGLNMYGAFDWLTGQDHSVSGNYTDDGRLRYTVSDDSASVLQKVLFGKWAGQNAQQYIEEGRSPLSQKQTQEFFDLGVSIEEYWEIQDGLKALNKESDSGKASINEVGDYIGGLDLTTQQKNILINKYAGRKNPIDMTDYDQYDSFEEFDYATQNPGKYAVSQAVGGFEKFKAYKAAFDNFDSKEKLVKYINNMKIPYGAKIILFVNEYKTKENREKYGADIVEYLNGRVDITRDEMVQILEELGFKVSKDGKVSY